MRIGVFGGAFDPVHFGHLILAEQCREQGRLDEVLFVPTARPPHKPQPAARFDQRVEMLALAVAGNPAFRLMRSKKTAKAPATPWTPSPNCAADGPATTSGSWPAATWCATFTSGTSRAASSKRPASSSWPVPARRRPTATSWPPASAFPPSVSKSSRRRGSTSPASDLRRRAAEGRSLRYLLPRAVECYVRDKRLYRQRKRRAGAATVRERYSEDRLRSRLRRTSKDRRRQGRARSYRCREASFRLGVDLGGHVLVVRVQRHGDRRALLDFVQLAGSCRRTGSWRPWRPSAHGPCRPCPSR